MSITTCNLLEPLSLNFEFNSTKNEFIIDLVSWFSNCKILAFGPLYQSTWCAGLSLMHQGNYKLQPIYDCH
jgi:hypothetical protein